MDTQFDYPFYSKQQSLIPNDEKRYLWCSEKMELYNEFITKPMTDDDRFAMLLELERENKKQFDYMMQHSFDYALIYMKGMERRRR